MMVDFELGEYIRTFSSQSHRWLSGTVEPPLTAISLQEPAATFFVATDK